MFKPGDRVRYKDCEMNHGGSGWSHMVIGKVYTVIHVVRSSYGGCCIRTEPNGPAMDAKRFEKFSEIPKLLKQYYGQV